MFGIKNFQAAFFSVITREFYQSKAKFARVFSEIFVTNAVTENQACAFKIPSDTICYLSLGKFLRSGQQ